MVGRGFSIPRQRACAGPKPRPSRVDTLSGGARTPPATSSASDSSTALVAFALSTITSSLTPKVFPLYLQPISLKLHLLKKLGLFLFESQLFQLNEYIGLWAFWVYLILIDQFGRKVYGFRSLSLSLCGSIGPFLLSSLFYCNYLLSKLH